MLERLADWLDRHAMACYYKKYLGIECPGCGMQRSMAELLRGHLAESITAFPALLPILMLLAFLALHLVLKFRHGGTILKYWFIFTVAIIVVNYVLKAAEMIRAIPPG